MPKRKSPTIRGKVTNWSRNFGQSVLYSSVDVLKDLAPSIYDTGTNASELGKSLVQDIREIKITQNKIKQQLNTIPAFKEAQNAAKNAWKDIKSGKINNQERLQRLTEKDMEMDFGGDDGDFEFNMDDSDMEFTPSSETDDGFGISEDIAEGVEPSVKSLKPGIESTANAARHSAAALGTIAEGQSKQTSAMINLGNASMQVSKQIAIADIQISQKMHKEKMEVYTAIADNTSKLVAFNDDTMSKFAMSSMDYYTKQLEISGGILEELKRIGEKVAPPKEEEEEEEKLLGWNDVFTGKGVMKFGKYGQLVKQNFNAALDNNSMLSMLKFLTEPEMLAQMAANPMEFVAKSVVENLIPTMIKTSLKELDKTIAGFFPSLIMKINQGRNKNALGELFADIFGIEVDTNREVEYGKYEKGAVPFDGITHKSINVVIPEYLSGILATLRQERQLAFDYENGVFKTKEDLRKEVADEDQYSKISGMSKPLSMLKDNLDKFQWNSAKELDDLKKKVDEMAARSVDENVMITEQSVSQLGDFSKKERMAIQAALRHMGRTNWMQFNVGAGKGAAAYNNRIDETQANSALMANRYQVGAGNVGYDEHLRRLNDYESIGDRDFRERFEAEDEWKKSQTDLLREIRDILSEGIITFPNGGITGGTTTGAGGIPPEILQRQKEFQRKTKSLKTHWEENDEAIKEKVYTKEEMEEGINAGKIDIRTASRNFKDEKDATSSLEASLRAFDTRFNRDKKDPNNPNNRKMGGWYESLDKWVNESTFGEKIVSIKDAVQKFFEAPSKMLSGAMDKVTNTLTTIIYGDPEHPEDSILAIARKRITETFDSLNNWLKKRYKAATNFLFGEGGFTDTKAYKWIKGKTEGIIDLVFGKKNGNGLTGRSGGAFSGAFNTLSDVFFDVRRELFGTPYKDSSGKDHGEYTGSVLGSFKSAVSSAFDNMNEYLFGKKEQEVDKDGKPISFLDKMVNYLDIGMNNFSKAIFGKSTMSGDGEVKSGAFKEFSEGFKKHLPKALAIGVVGAGIATFSNFGILGSLFLPGGPIGGAILGTTVGFLAQSEKFRAFLFGPKDLATGNRMGGLISKGVMDWVKKHKTALVGGATFGALKGVIGGLGVLNLFGPLGMAANFLLPGGPIGGALLGAAVGIGWKSQVFQNMLYGKQDEKTGKKIGGLLNTQFSINVKKYLPNMMFGGLAFGVGGLALGQMGLMGAMLTPGGPIGAAIMGSALGIGLASEKFKSFMFGERDKDGELKKAGIFQRLSNFLNVNVVSRLSLKLKEMSLGVENWFRRSIVLKLEEVTIPLKNAFSLLGDEIKTMFKSGWKFMTDSINKIFTEAVGLPLGKFMEERVLKPMRSFFGNLINGLGKVFGSILASPVNAMAIMTNAMLGRYDRKGIRDSRNERKAAFRGAVTGLFKGSKIKNEETGEERDATFRERLNLLFNTGAGVVTQYGSRQTKEDSNRYHTAEMKDEEAKNKAEIDAKRNAWEEEYKAKRKALDDQRNALNQIADEAAKDNYSSAKGYTREYDKKFNPTTVGIAPSPTPSGEKPREDETKPGTPVINDGVLRNEFGDIMLGYTPKEEKKTGKKLSRFTGIGRRLVGTGADQTAADAIAEAQDIIEESTSNTEAIVGSITPITSALTVAQETRERSVNILEITKGLLSNIFELQKAMAYRETGNKSILDYEGSPGNLALSTDEQAVMKNKTAAAKDPKTGEVKKDATQIAEEQKEAKRKKNEDLIAEVQAKTAKEHEDAKGVKGKESDTVALPNGTVLPTAPQQTNKPGTPAIASAADRKYDQDKGITGGDSGDLATKYLRIIAQSVDGQLDGVGSNVYKSRKLLQIIAGAEDDDITGSGNKDRVGFFGKMRRMAFDLFTNPFRFVKNIIAKPFEIVADYGKKIVDTAWNLVSGIGKGFKVIGETLWEGTKQFGKMLLSVPGAVLDIAKGVGTVVKETLVAGVKVIGEGLVGMTKGAFAVIEGAAKGIGHVINGFGKGLGLIMEGIGNASKALFKGFGEALSMGIEVAGTVAKGAVNLFTGLTEGAVNLTVEAMKGITIVGKELVKGVSSLITNTASLMFSLVTSPISFLGSKLGLTSRTKHVIIDGGTLDTVKIVEVVELVRKIDGGGAHSPLTGLANKVTNALSGAQKEEKEEAGQVANEQKKDKPDGGVSSNVTAEMAKSGLVQVGGMVKRTASTMKAVKEQIAEKKMVMDNETEQTSILGQIRDQGVKREAWWKKLLGWAGALLLFLKDKIGTLGAVVGGILAKFGEDLIKRGKDFVKTALKSTAEDIKTFIKSLFNRGNGGSPTGDPNKPGANKPKTGKPTINKPKPAPNKPGAIAEEPHPTGKPNIGKVPTPLGNTPAPALPGEKPPPQLNASVFGEMEQTKTVNGQTWGARTNASGAKEIFELKNGKWEFRGVGVPEAPTPKIGGPNLPTTVGSPNVPSASVVPETPGAKIPGPNLPATVGSPNVPSTSLAPEMPGTVSASQTVAPQVGAEAGEDMATKVPRLIKSALEMIDGLAGKLLGRPVSCASELGKKIFSVLTKEVITKNAARFAEGFAKGVAGMAGPLGAALNAVVAAWGIGSGYHDAAYMFQVDEGAVTPAMRAAALIPKTILTLWFLPCVILNIALAIIGAIVGVDHYGWLAQNLFHFFADTKEQERIEQAQKDFKEAAIEAGFGVYETGADGSQVLTDVDVTAYNKQVNKTLGDKVLDGWQTFKDEIGKNYEMLGSTFGPLALLPPTWPILTAIRHASDTETAHWLADKGTEFKTWVGESFDSASKKLGELADDFMNSSFVKWLTEDSEEKPGEVAVDQGTGDEPTITEELFTGTDESPGMFSDFGGWVSSKLVDLVTSPEIGIDRKTIDEHGLGIATLSYFMRRDPKDISQMFTEARENVSKMADSFYDATIGVAKENWQRTKDSANLWIDEKSKAWKEFSEPIAEEAIQRWNNVKKGFNEWTENAGKWWDENIGEPALKKWDKAKADLNWMAEGFNKWTDDMAEWWEKTDIIGEIKKSTMEFFFGTEEKPTRLKQALVAVGNVGDTIQKGVENFGKSLVEALSDAVEMLKLEISVKWSEWMSEGFSLFGIVNLGERELYDWEVKEKERLNELHAKLDKSREDQMMSFVGQGPGGYHKMSDYANTKYGATGTYDTSGCAPVALSNVAKNLGVNVDPRDIGNAMVQSGDRVPGGTSETAFTGSIVKSLGLNSYKANSLSDLAQMKRAGMEVIVGGVGSDYTKAGHYQQLESIGKDGAIVYDENGRFKKISLSNLASQTKTAYGFTGSGEGDGGSGVLSAITGELSKLGIPDMSGIMDNLARGETIPSSVFHKLTDWFGGETGPFGVFKNAVFAGFKAVAEWLFGGIPGGNLMVDMATGGTTNVFGDFFGSMKESLQTKWNELKNWLFSDNNLSKESVFDAFKTGLTNAANALKDGASSAWNKAKDIKRRFFGSGGFGGTGSFHSTSFRGLGPIERTSDLDDYGGPDYNRLNSDDSESVARAKIAAQRKWIAANDATDTKNTSIGGNGSDLTNYFGPMFNRISEDDSDIVKTAKLKAQRKWIYRNIFFGSGNEMFMPQQSAARNCTMTATAALKTAYEGTKYTSSDFNSEEPNWWYRVVKEMGPGEVEHIFYPGQGGEFASYLESSFGANPDHPMMLYQVGGAGKSGGHPINRGEGNHATVIGRRLPDGTYEIYDSNGGVIHKLNVDQIFDPTANGNSQGYGDGQGNILFNPTIDPSSPITSWGSSGEVMDEVGSAGKSGGSVAAKEKPKGLFDILGGLSSMYANFADAAFKGKVYNPKDYESSSSSSGGSSSGGSNYPVDTGENAQAIWKFFKERGMNDTGIAGIMGNMSAESGLDPTRVEVITPDDYDAGTAYPVYQRIGGHAAIDKIDWIADENAANRPGYGLVQWTWGSLQAGLNRKSDEIGKPVSDLATQLNYLWDEGIRTGVTQAVQEESTPEAAADRFMTDYERPGIAHSEERARGARQFYEAFKGSGEGDNLEGYTGPSYNFITDDDSSAVKAAKIIAQKKWMQTNVFKPDIQATKVTIFDDISKKLSFGEQLEEVKKMAEEKKENDYSDLWGKMVDILGEIASNTKGLDKSIQGIKLPPGLNRTIILPTGAGGSDQMSNVEMTVNNGSPTPSKQAEANAKIAAGGEFKK